MRLERNEPITVRLPEGTIRELKREATKRDLRPSEYARRILLEAMTDAGRGEIRDELRELRRIIQELRDDIHDLLPAASADSQDPGESPTSGAHRTLIDRFFPPKE